ncbi:hypothetical protein V8E52_011427 [Russula decolorans]
MSTYPSEIAVDRPPDVLEVPAEQSIEFESHFSDTSSVVVDTFPFGNPGAPIPGVPQGRSSYELFQVTQEGIWAPFRSQRDWDIARWTKTHSTTSSAVADLLAIPEVPDTLGLSYHTVKELNDLIDHKLPGRPSFRRKELIIGQERLEFYCRDVLECIRSLFGDPQYAEDLVFAPERHYTSRERKSRLYHEMYTCDWWWTIQEEIESRQTGATIVPVIISSDKTQLTPFRDTKAYPIYMTIGNIPKSIRRKPSQMAQILIGYIPTTKLTGLTNQAARCRALANLFHACMRDVLHPIIGPGRTGVAIKSGDGVWRRCHPIFANFVGDYPEQALVTCTFSGQCPKCKVTPDELGEYETFGPRLCQPAIDAFRLADGEVHVFHAACRNVGLKPIYHPFWESLPLADIFIAITPDVLHQLLQGTMKYLVKWVVRIFGPTEINARCRSMPPNHKTKLFTKGITSFSYISGHEHKKMCSILLGLVVDLPIPGGWDSTRLVCAVRGLLDFLYLAQYQCHTSETLDHLQDALSVFHGHKAIFTDLGIREHFNIPKFHSLTHYVSSIVLFGTTDNYNTEQSERLHIDFAKQAYRATNRKDIYSQMTAWLQRREKILLHTAFITWRLRKHPRQPRTRRIPDPPRVPTQSIKMALNPTKSVTFDGLAHNYGAVGFQDALADFLAHQNYPLVSASSLRQRAADTLIPFRSVPVFHSIKFTKCGLSGESEISDTVHARPEAVDTRSRVIPARFDTVVVHRDGLHGEGLKGVCIAQVRVVFQIPRKAVNEVAPSLDTSAHLAYVEWFSPFAAAPDPKHRMYKVTRMLRNGRRSASIIRVDTILSSVHLFPRFGATTPREWNTFTVLELCNTFYVNPFADVDSYLRFE